MVRGHLCILVAVVPSRVPTGDKTAEGYAHSVPVPLPGRGTATELCRCHHRVGGWGGEETLGAVYLGSFVLCRLSQPTALGS